MDLSFENTAIYAAISLLITTLTLNYFEYKRIAAVKTVRFKFAFSPLLSVAIAPLLIPSLIFFAIYRQIVNLILTLKYGPKYGGLLEGTDVVHIVHGPTIVQGLYLIQHNQNSPQSFYDTATRTAQKIVSNKLKRNIKFFGVVRKFMGYSFVIQNQVTCADTFKTLKTASNPKEEITEVELMQLISESNDIQLPKEGTAFWDVFVGTQSIKQDTQDDGLKLYPILVRLQHSLTDGFHGFASLTDLFADDERNENIDDNKRANTLPQHHCSVTDKQEDNVLRTILNFVGWLRFQLVYYVKQLHLMLLAPSLMLVNALLQEAEPHILHGAQLSNKKLLSFHLEKSPQYCQAIKRIKTKIPGSTFESIWLSAVTASLGDYFRKKSNRTPEYLLAAVPCLPEALQLRKMTPKKSKEREIQCRNSLSFTLRKLPVGLAGDDSDTALINILQSVSKEGNSIKGTAETAINYWALSVIFTLLPEPFLRILTDMVYQTTAILSNLPFPPNLTVLGGLPLLNAVAWPANRANTGLCLIVTSYGEQLQLSIIVDTALISDFGEVQDILNRIGKYIMRLDDIASNISRKT